jgi:hypothetical protein
MGLKIMKVSSRIYKGIEYILLTDLPQDQREKIVEFLREDSLIKILVESKVCSNCVQYREYEAWFDNVFAKQPLSPRTRENATPVLLKMVKA